ncbi:MAG TPA: DUF1427 family protein [Acidobacteriota bacterium]|nr:DUF1427 family protein [Acidobacteriota bacterium]
MSFTVKVVISVLIGIGIGAACRWFKLPVPAPPTLIGALLVTSITVGYQVTDHWLGSPAQAQNPAAQEEGVDSPSQPRSS